MFFDEVYAKYSESATETVSSVNFGRLVKRLFPQITTSKRRSKLSGKNVPFYQGIAFRCSSSDGGDLPTPLRALGNHLPENSVLLANSDTKLSFGLHSGYICNGNVLLKSIDLSVFSWQLSIRGMKIDLESLQVCNVYEGTNTSFNTVVSTVERTEVCIGLPLERVNNQLKDSLVIKENVSKFGDENSSKLMVRSKHCLQVLAWSQQESCCRRCQIDLRRTCPKKSDACRTAEDQPSTKKKKNNDFSSNFLVEKDDNIELDEEDNKTLSTLLDKALPGASGEMKKLLQDQQKALTASHVCRRRWSPEVISLCLGMFIRSPKSYDELKDSNMLILPSGRQLQRYKNFIPQGAGLNRKALEWMYHAALESKVPAHGWAGGLIHDETKIQSDLVLSMRDGILKLIGWIDTGEEGDDLRTLKNGCLSHKLATEAFQVIFLGYTGFRFPIYHCPTAGISASELCIIIHQCIAELHDYGFQVDFVLQDGGQENRQFIKAHFLGKNEAT